MADEVRVPRSGGRDEIQVGDVTVGSVPTSDGKTRPLDLRVRTRDFAISIIGLHAALPRRREAWVIGGQFLRSGTSVGTNYREGIRARSKAEYAAKLNSSLMELEETSYWLEVLDGSKLVGHERVAPLLSEASELTAILVTLIKKAKQAKVKASDSDTTRF